MSNWTVQDRATGEVVHAYDAESAVDWPDFPFSDYNHIVHVEPSPVQEPVERNISGVQYMRRFTQAERIAIREAAKSSAALDDYLRLLDLTIAQGGVVNLNDPDVAAALNMLETFGLIAAGRAAEVLA